VGEEKGGGWTSIERSTLESDRKRRKASGGDSQGAFLALSRGEKGKKGPKEGKGGSLR